MGGRCVPWMLALSGCAFVWRIDEVPAPTPDARGPDSAVDSPADAAVCSPSPVFSDPLTDTTGPCASWGFDFLDPKGSIAEGAGSLIVTMTGGPGLTGCYSNSPLLLDGRGFFVAIDDYFRQGGAYTHLSLLLTGTGNTPDMNGPRYTFGPGNGFLELYVNGTRTAFTPYVAGAMKFVRLRGDTAPATMVIAEYSEDAAHWHELARDSSLALPPGGVWVELVAGETATGTFNDTATFSHFNVCP